MVLSVKSQDIWLLLLVFALRFAAIVVPGDMLQTDPDGYLRLAQEVVTSGVYGSTDENGTTHPTAFRPPAYPYLLAATIWLTGTPSLWAIATLHGALASLSAALLLSIGRTLQLKFAVAAVCFFSLDPLLLRQSQLIMTETVATTGALLSWWLAMQYEQFHQSERAHVSKPLTVMFAILVGASFGLATLTRPTAIVWLALIIVTYLVHPREQRSSKFQQAAWLWVGFMLVISPWISRNREHFGKSIWATTHGGYTLLLANNPILYDHFQSGSVSRDWDEDLFHQLWSRHDLADPKSQDFWDPDRLNIDVGNPPAAIPVAAEKDAPKKARHPEVAEDELAQAAAVETIRTQPLVFAWSALIRMGWLWTPLPNPRPDSWIKWPICGWYLVLYSCAIAGALGLRNRNLTFPWLVGWLLVISLTLVHCVYWSNIRMRAPAMPMIYLLAAFAAQSLIFRKPKDEKELGN